MLTMLQTFGFSLRKTKPCSMTLRYSDPNGTRYGGTAGEGLATCFNRFDEYEMNSQYWTHRSLLSLRYRLLNGTSKPSHHQWWCRRCNVDALADARHVVLRASQSLLWASNARAAGMGNVLQHVDAHHAFVAASGVVPMYYEIILGMGSGSCHDDCLRIGMALCEVV